MSCLASGHINLRNAYADLESSQDNTVFFRNQAELTYQFLQLAYKQRKLGERSLIDVLIRDRRSEVPLDRLGLHLCRSGCFGSFSDVA